MHMKKSTVLRSSGPCFWSTYPKYQKYVAVLQDAIQENAEGAFYSDGILHRRIYVETEGGKNCEKLF